MPERKKIGEAGAASPTLDFTNLKAEHMTKPMASFHATRSATGRGARSPP